MTTVKRFRPAPCPTPRQRVKSKILALLNNY
jgi:hypothetical protein